MTEPLTEEQKDMIASVTVGDEPIGGLSGSFQGVPCVYLVEFRDEGNGIVSAHPRAVLCEGKFLEAFAIAMEDCDGRPLVAMGPEA